MRHRKSGRKFGMDSTARKAMFRNMVTSLLLHGQIRTTEERAKELRKRADRIISLGKNAPTANAIEALEGDARQKAHAARVHAIRRAKLWVNNDDALGKVFGEYAERFATRPGGYTRIVKMRRRDGDNAKMAFIQVVEAWEGKAAEAAPDVEVTEVTEVAAAPLADIEETEVAESVVADAEATEVAKAVEEDK